MESNNLPAEVTNAQVPTRFSIAEELDFDERGSSGPGLKRYIRALWRYKWLVVLAGILGGVFGVVASRFVRLTYTAQGTVFLQTIDAASDNQGPIRSTQVLRDNAWIELLRSVPVLEPVVREQRLYARYALVDRDIMESLRVDSVLKAGQYRLRVDEAGMVELLANDGTLVEEVRAGEPLGSSIGLIWTPPASALQPGRELTFAVSTPVSAAIRLGHSDEFRTNMPQRSNFVSLAYVDEDPERAAAVINGITRSFMSVATDLKRVHLVETLKDLEEQLTYARQNLEAAEFALNDFLVNTATLPTQPASPVNPGTQETRAEAMNSYFSLRIQRDELQRDRVAIERAFADGGAVSIDALNVVASVQQSPELRLALDHLTSQRAELRTLLRQFTPNHPQSVRAQEQLTNLEQVVIPQLARNLMAELDNRIAVLDGLVESSAGELQAIPPRLISEAGFRRAVASAETLHNNLLQRFENARLAAETTQPDVSVLVPASVPQSPDSDKRIQIIAMALIAGLGLGAGLAVALELLDRRVRYPEQISGEMRLTILGAIPDFTMRRKLFSSSPDRAELVEALRGVRLSLAHAYGAAGPIMVTVTSPGAGDGKTFVTSNLACTFAELGARTLIIDGDTRRGTMHQVLNVPRRPGLTDYLSRNASLDDVIRQTDFQNLDMIPCGRPMANSPELLSSPLMGEMLRYIRARYDVVLVDSPPLGAGVDPLILAAATGNVALIMRTGRTDRTLAEAKLQMMERLPIRVLGAILNGIGGEAAYRYYSYLPGYEATEEDKDVPPRRLQSA